MDSGSPLEAQCIRLSDELDPELPTPDPHSPHSTSDTSGAAWQGGAAAGAGAGPGEGGKVVRTLGVTATLSRGLALLLRNTLRMPIAEIGAQEVTLGLPPQVRGLRGAGGGGRDEDQRN